VAVDTLAGTFVLSFWFADETSWAEEDNIENRMKVELAAMCTE